jgi:hypothetical protein
MSPLKRQDAKYNLWDNIRKPIKVYDRACESCKKVRSVEFNFNQENRIKTIYACSLTCFNELQKEKK